ncbi:MAG: alpha/beta hydrolase, partial [Paludibacteraceae bacterium]|nr:alpha/beta hydrolase [Paludibacteraceae bacterium]
MKYNIDKQFGLWRHMKQPVMGERFFRLAERIVKTEKYFLSHKDVNVDTITIQTIDNYPLNSYLITPNKLNSDGIILYLHGGGFCFKGSESHADICVKYANEVGCKLLFVEYRLAHNTPYPTPEDDCILMYKYLIDNAEALGVSAEKIIVAGDSAGGNLALGVFYNAVNENITKPHALMLVYPVVDNLMQTESMKKFTDTPMWNAVLNEAMWKVYLPTDSAKDLFKRNHVEANLYTEFPSTYIESAEFDCLRDE